MIDRAIGAALSADAGVTAIVGTRIRSQTSSSRLDYPMLTFQQIASGVETTRKLDGAVTVFRTLQQIDLYAANRTQAVNLAAAVRAALDGKINQTWGGLTILASIFDDQRDGNFEDSPELTGLFRIIQQYRISYQA